MKRNDYRTRIKKYTANELRAFISRQTDLILSLGHDAKRMKAISYAENRLQKLNVTQFTNQSEVTMKRYHFNLWNDDRIIDTLHVVANSLQSAREKVSFQIGLKYAGVASSIKAELYSQSAFKF